MPLSFRPARVDDADVAVALIHSSGPGAINYVFCADHAGQAQEFLHRAYLSGRGRFGWRNHWVACVDGRVAGIGAGYGADRNLRFLLDEGLLILRHYGLRAIGVVTRGLLAERVMPPPARGEWMIAHVAVAPAQRGSGIGARLMNFLVAQGARAGQGSAVLDVSIDNPRAEVLYRRLGFTLVAERPSALESAYGLVARHRRLMLPAHLAMRG